MNAFRRLVFLLAVVLSGTAAALPPGEYVMVNGGWGTLKIGAAAQGVQSFSIETVGANLHTCTVDGTVKGDLGKPSDSMGESCEIRLTAKGRDIEVAPVGEGEGCRVFCGARAYFDGTFRLPPAQCTTKALQQRRNAFLGDYRAKRYAPAMEKIDALYRECGEFYDWVAIDALRNDIAITQLHLGRPADCLKTLGETRAWESADEKALQEESGLPPSDFDIYIETAKATWANRRLCEKALKKAAK